MGSSENCELMDFVRGFRFRPLLFHAGLGASIGSASPSKFRSLGCLGVEAVDLQFTYYVDGALHRTHAAVEARFGKLDALRSSCTLGLLTPTLDPKTREAHVPKSTRGLKPGAHWPLGSGTTSKGLLLRGLTSLRF